MWCFENPSMKSQRVVYFLYRCAAWLFSEEINSHMCKISHRAMTAKWEVSLKCWNVFSLLFLIHLSQLLMDLLFKLELILSKPNLYCLHLMTFGIWVLFVWIITLWSAVIGPIGHTRHAGQWLGIQLNNIASWSHVKVNNWFNTVSCFTEINCVL